MHWLCNVEHNSSLYRNQMSMDENNSEGSYEPYKEPHCQLVSYTIHFTLISVYPIEINSTKCQVVKLEK